MFDFFREKKYGFFAHYVWVGTEFVNTSVVGAMYPDGTPVQSVEEMIEQFDAEQFAEDMKCFGVEYVIFTSHHFNMNPLYPSEVFRRWRTHQEDNPERGDLIEKVYLALKRYNIDLYLYIHPYDIHDFCELDKEKFGYVGSTREECDNHIDKKMWHDYIDETYRELMLRYKGRIKGIYLDEAYGDPMCSEKMNDYVRIREAIKSVDPEAVMIQNYYGSCYTLDTGMLENAVVWHGAVYDDVNTWATTPYSSGTVFRNYAGSWWANCTKEGTTKNQELLDDPKAIQLAKAEHMFQYTLFEAGQNQEGGGTAWAAGPYCGFWTDQNGQKQIWEPGVRDTMIKLGTLLKPVMESISGTVPSKSFVTTPEKRLGEVAWGSATESYDGEKTYVHILKPPVSGKSLNLGIPEDGKIFSKALALREEKEVLISQTETGVTVTLPEDMDWDEYATVLVLTNQIRG